MNIIKKHGPKIEKFIPLMAFIVILFFVFTPIYSFAQAQGNIIPCNGPDCDFNSLVKLGANIINFLIQLSFVIVVVVFCYAGFLYLTSGSNPGQREKANKIFMKVLKGFLWILLAWVLVYTILNALVDTNKFPILLGKPN